jgi:hypothetical protein
MALSGLLDVLSVQYLTTVGRVEELERLQMQAQRRKSMLVFGPEAVGKTRLLESFVKTQEFALYVNNVQSPRDLMLCLAEGLRKLRALGSRLPANLGQLKTPSLKGIVQRALDLGPFILVFDHLQSPSRIVTGMIKELNYYGRTPIFFAARSPHMEDIGALSPMCCDRSERLEMKSFIPSVALEFAQRAAEQTMLRASNMEGSLQFIAEKSDGNPGAILQMLRMALLPRYRVDDQIKAHVLYLDYRMGRNG